MVAARPDRPAGAYAHVDDPQPEPITALREALEDDVIPMRSENRPPLLELAALAAVILGIIVAAVGVGAYDWRAGMVVGGAGLVVLGVLLGLS